MPMVLGITSMRLELEVHTSTPAVIEANVLLLEDGFYILLENGDAILLEVGIFLLEDGSELLLEDGSNLFLEA